MRRGSYLFAHPLKDKSDIAISRVHFLEKALGYFFGHDIADREDKKVFNGFKALLKSSSTEERLNLLSGRIRIDPSNKSHGKFTSVYEGHYLDGKKVVVKLFAEEKITDPNHSHYQQIFSHEARMMQALKEKPGFDRIIDVLESGILNNQRCLVMEFMENRSLNDFLENNALKRSQRYRIAFDVIEGLVFLHGAGMFHGNLDGGNVLLDGAFRAKLGDFVLSIQAAKAKLERLSETGMERKEEKGSGKQDIIGLCIPPEFKRFDRDEGVYTKESDIYSLGVILNRLLGISKSASLKCLIDGCCEIEPKGRPAIKQVWDHLKNCLKDELRLERSNPLTIEELLSILKEQERRQAEEQAKTQADSLARQARARQLALAQQALERQQARLRVQEELSRQLKEQEEQAHQRARVEEAARQVQAAQQLVLAQQALAQEAEQRSEQERLRAQEELARQQAAEQAKQREELSRQLKEQEEQAHQRARAEELARQAQAQQLVLAQQALERQQVQAQEEERARQQREQQTQRTEQCRLLNERLAHPKNNADYIEARKDKRKFFPSPGKK